MAGEQNVKQLTKSEKERLEEIEAEKRAARLLKANDNFLKSKKKYVQFWETVCGVMKVSADKIKWLNECPADETFKSEVPIGFHKMIGTFEINDTKWKILGGNIQLPAIKRFNHYEYLVVQIPISSWMVRNEKVVESMPCNGREQLMRICFDTSAESRDMFLNEISILKQMRLIYRGNRRNYDRFPRLFQSDAFSKHFFEVCNKQCEWTPSLPSPFYIYEKVGPTLETFLKFSKEGRLASYTAVYIIIGCIQALRLLHEASFVHRDVQPAHFAIRLRPSGMLNRNEFEVTDRVVLTHFGFACNFREDAKKKNRKGRRSVGVRRYSSTQAMRHEAVLPADDLTSCIYMLYEFVCGRLPWDDLPGTELQKIYNRKKDLEKSQEINYHSTKDTFLMFKSVDKIMELIRAGYNLSQLDYHQINKKLIDGAVEKKKNDKTATLFTYFNGIKRVYRHGIEFYGDPGKDTRKPVGEPEHIRYQVDYLFPVPLDEVDLTKPPKPAA